MFDLTDIDLTDLPALAAAELAATHHAVDWIWHGYVARGNTTLFTGIWKGGKTTLLSLLLARRVHGGTLAGLKVAPGKTLVITEESSDMWHRRIHRLNIDGAWFIPRPFKSIPTAKQWQSLLDLVMKFRDRENIDLVIIDPLACFLPNENNSRDRAKGKGTRGSLIKSASLVFAGMTNMWRASLVCGSISRR